MNFSLGSMMGMMGGAPVVKSGDVIINKLKAAKVMEPGDMGGIMNSALKQGLGKLSSLLQNPMKSSGGKAQQATSNAQSGINSFQFPQTLNATNALGTVVNDVMAAAADVVGLGDDPEGLLSAVSAGQTLDAVGQTEPTLSHAALLSPALTDDQMNLIADTLPVIVAAVAAGGLADEVGAARIDALGAPLTTVLEQFQAARQAAEDHAVMMASITAAAALLITGPPEWRAVLEKAMLPEVLAAVQAASADLLSTE